ncbi:MAG: SpoIIE family protein phosphatase [Capsulimonas sp.]|uniref:PP2C family protein-serine/threonine phosphatase n=1 Tax=Capsulimonas sp. TaxID=2494211 RepID=UPI003267E786|nr:multi-sensor hybrid histidine kinase [Capsulimonas sp.]
MTNTKIEASEKRLYTLRQAQGKQASPERIVLMEAFHEIEVTLEELRVVEEELRRQNDELSEARNLVEAERVRYRHLFDLAPHGYVLTDGDGIILEANRAAAVMLSVEQRNLRRKPMAVYLGPGDKSVFYRELSSLRNGDRRVDFDARITPRGAEVFDANIAASAGPNDSGPTYLWVVQDITERKRAENKLAAFAAELEDRVERRTMQLNAAYEHQRRIAETLQLALMPAVSLEDPTIDLYTGYEAALDEAQVGGDFCDAFEYDGHMALVVGDVSGKGLTAAVYTSQVRFVLRAFLNQGLDAAGALSQLNDYIYAAQGRGDWNPNTFVAISLVIAVKGRREIEIFTAGIEPILVRASGEYELIPNQGMILGVFPGYQYVAVTRTLEPGDMAVLATDGFAEARRNGTFFGSEGLARLTYKCAMEHDEITVAGKAVQRGLREYAGGGLHDDICLLIAKRK